MQPFRTLTAVAAPLLRDNVDTDTIIPSREIKSVSKHGLAGGLFAGWRYRPATERSADPRDPDPDFVLGRPEFADARILLSGANFGCGSSREQAVWALAEYGFRAIVAASFAPIFFDNCVNNGVLALCLPRATVHALAEAVLAAPRTRLTIDLERGLIGGAPLGAIAFDLDAEVRERLLEGLDAIDLTLRRVAGLDAFYRRDRRQRPWVYLASSEPPGGRAA
jgi:3-isopropylmalate/(R)-2-methylmalate dehydratase small subunit